MKFNISKIELLKTKKNVRIISNFSRMFLDIITNEIT